MGSRKVTVLGATALMVGVLATPASGHAAFDGDRWAPADTDQQLTLNVPEEEGPDVHNAVVMAKLPHKWRAVACAPVAGWQCAIEGSPAVIRWTRNAGAPNVARETFTFTVHTGPADHVAVPVIQTYADGEVVEWTEGKHDWHPAPTFKVKAVESPPPKASVTPSPSPSVLGVQIQRPPKVLPKTGTNMALPTAIGALLAALGGGVLLAGRRRKRSAD